MNKKFAQLSFDEKFKVFWHYRCVFIFLKAIDGYEFNCMDFQSFCNHKYHWGTGEADRWLECFQHEIFSTNETDKL